MPLVDILVHLPQKKSTVRAPVFSQAPVFLAPQSITEKRMEVYYLDE